MADIKILEGEEWKDVVGFEGAYMISNKGRLLSLKRNGIGDTHLMKQNNNGRYSCVNLKYNGKTTKTTIHRIMACAFIENHNNLPQVDHINGDGHDNRLENLRWVNALDNIRNPVTLKRHNEKMKSLRNNSRSKPIAQKTKDGTLIAIYPSIREAVRITGIDKANISAVANKKNKTLKDHVAKILTAGGFKWEFIN